MIKLSMNKKIGFYIFYVIYEKFNQDEMQSRIINYIAKIIQDKEKEINSKGGIAGKKINIIFDIVNEDQPNEDHFQKIFQENKNIHFAICPNYFDFKNVNSKYIDEENNFLFFDFLTYLGKDDLPENVVDISSDSPKNWRKLPMIFQDVHLDLLINNNSNFSQEDKSLYTSKGFHLIYQDKMPSNFMRDYFENQTSNQMLVFGPYALDQNIRREERIKTISALGQTYLQSTGEGSLYINSLDPRHKAEIFSIETDGRKKEIFTSEADCNIFLRAQDIFSKVDKDMDDLDSEYLNWFLKSIESINLIDYIFEDSYFYKDRKSFIGDAKKRLSKIDGKNDIFRGDYTNLAFKNKRNLSRDFLFEKLTQSNVQSLALDKTLYKNQIVSIDQEDIVRRVNFINFDILKVSKVSIENGTFNINFYLDISSPLENPIDIIKFDNLGPNSKEPYVKKISSHFLQDEEYFFSRYYLDAEFNFFEVSNNYPFDRQMLFLSYSIIDENKFGILQPISKNNIDSKFTIDGWNIDGVRSGIFRRKIKISTGISAENLVSIENENRIGWEISRESSLTLLKILIPLGFLSSLVIYSMFLPLENLDRAVGLLTTSFLSSIALYFSTERPQPLTFTLIDLIFAIFYIFVGISTALIFCLEFFPNIYTEAMPYIRSILPFSLIGAYFFLRQRVRSNKFSPKMMSDDA